MKNQPNVSFRAIVYGDKIEKEYQYLYYVKVVDYNRYFYVSIPKKQNQQLEYGDYIHVTGIYKEPEKQRNYSGFDYSEYLKQKKIIGTIKVEKVEIIQKTGKSNMSNST